jgi:hypothetical protein
MEHAFNISSIIFEKYRKIFNKIFALEMIFIFIPNLIKMKKEEQMNLIEN